MNEISPAKYRDINIITAEIRTIQDSVRRTALEGAIEIGRRLTEAKELLPHGEWGNWLKEEFEFSQPTASRLMTLFKEYGADQASLFGAESKYSTLNNLSVSKALRLIAIPSEEREEWAGEHDVENLSTRELDRLIKEKEAADKAREEAERESAEAHELLNRKTDEYITLNAEAHELREQVDDADVRIRETTEKLTKQVSEARAARDQAEGRLQKAEKKSSKAEQEAAKAREELQKLKENPVIPPELIERAAEEKAADARKEAERARAELEEARKALALSCPSAAVFAAYFKQVQMDFNKMFEALEETLRDQPETGEKLVKAARVVVAQIAKRLEGGNG